MLASFVLDSVVLASYPGSFGEATVAYAQYDLSRVPTRGTLYRDALVHFVL